MKRAEFLLTFYFLLMISGILYSETSSDQIRLNQIGFYPQETKNAVIVNSPTDDFFLVNKNTNRVVYTGVLKQSKYWSYSGETVRIADFSDFNDRGEYFLLIPGVGTSHPFKIEDYVHQEVATACLKGFYYQRASLFLTPIYAGNWWRPKGHPDDEVKVHPSAATVERPAGTIISASRGWYDAGDFNKYIVNSGISTYTVLSMYEHFPEYFAVLKTNIPESENQLPDVLDEALWNIRWMLTMQDPYDGGVYHKLTNPDFVGFIMPHLASGDRYVVQKSTQATLDFAAVMAQANRIFSEFEDQLPDLADSCLIAALNAWNWARQNPDSVYDQDRLNQYFSPKIHTGEYGGRGFTDEYQWAAMELFITTGEDSFLAITNPFADSDTHLPWWQNVRTLGFYSLLHYRKDIADVVDTTDLKRRIINFANWFKEEKDRSAYAVMMGRRSWDFVWGSNSNAANQGILMIQAFRVTQDSSYLEAAIANLDYLLGRNATTYSFVTGYGSKTPMHIHHAISVADNVWHPIPGLLAGGPNPGQQDGCPGYPSSLPALSYLDDVCSYASNEIAINWNAPIAYLAFAIESILSPDGKPKTTTQVERKKFQPRSFFLKQNFPNPFNSMTKIAFSLSQTQRISLKIYNVKGELVRTLIDNELRPANDYLVEFDAQTLPSGIYFCQLKTAQGEKKKYKMLLIK